MRSPLTLLFCQESVVSKKLKSKKLNAEKLKSKPLDSEKLTPETFDVMTLTQSVNGPPMKLFIRNNGGIALEPCVLVGHISMERSQRDALDALGILTSWSQYDPEAGRWEHCLMSDAVADLLCDLHAEGSFPYAFEVCPSRGEATWQKAQAEGDSIRPILPLSEYLLPAESTALDALAGIGIEPRRIRRLPWVES